MNEKQKVLICGDVEGHFKFLFNKVEAINKKSGPFDFLLCVGNFFGEDNVELEVYKNAAKHISVPTYIIGANRESDLKNYPDEDGCEICHNLTYLGKRGVYTATSGLKIAYVSGTESDSSELKPICFNESDVVSIKNSCLRGQPSFRGIDILLTSPWPAGVTNLDPNKPNFTYQGSKLIAWLAAQVKPRYHVSALEGIHYERPPYRNQSQQDGNIEIATRFIALAPVVNTQKKKWLYALNLTPVDRTRLSDLVMKTTDETKNVKEEMDRYKNAIAKYYGTVDKVPVFFERNYKTSHCQLQVIPVHKNLAPALKETFMEMAECNNFKIVELPLHSDLQQIAKPGVLYFYVELPNGEKLYYRIKKDFPLQFGREVLAADRILDISDRIDWKDCQMTKEEEIELANRIRKEFQPFDLDI
ncbi:CWF19-like protein 1 isoform X2 [Halictus rubicundus]|uniref:CWF19-like protein 1 isoform X2 n=1 Tax=Halictus rubicundus TaxID=77578 RepID=UPI00403563B8